MDNYEAIMRMDKTQLCAFLDNVYLTGLNTGMYAASLESDSKEQSDLLDQNPYGAQWLAETADDSTAKVFDADGDMFMPEALTQAIFRIAGIDPKTAD